MNEGLAIAIGFFGGAFFAGFVFLTWPELFFEIIESSEIIRKFRGRRRKAWLIKTFKNCSSRREQNAFIKETINHAFIPVNKNDLLIMLKLLSSTKKLYRIHEIVLSKIKSKKFKLTNDDMSFIVSCYQLNFEKRDFEIFYDELIDVYESSRKPRSSDDSCKPRL